MNSVDHRSATASGIPPKRLAILRAGLEVFARDGFARTSVEKVAEVAAVSTRTVYNHFTDKAGLFAAVVEFSSAAVSEIHIGEIEKHLGTIGSRTEVEPALVSYGLSMHSSVPPNAPHWRLVTQLQAETEHISSELLESWRRSGPLRTRRQIALHLSDLARRGYLELDDPDIAAAHLAALINASRSDILDPDPSAERLEELMRSAIGTFLHGYAAAEPL
ncbi:TetR/AcrR family transcriptional regulator [Brevibacterium sp. XM4083]|nr:MULTISPECIES: TetR/AcrR family transcriptional regulator [unclassified Brevibacterium]MCM1013346.1 TetR/AcrR family transcriptional regulator [Brevibacterium sp. XM4083]